MTEPRPIRRRFLAFQKQISAQKGSQNVRGSHRDPPMPSPWPCEALQPLLTLFFPTAMVLFSWKARRKRTAEMGKQLNTTTGKQNREVGREKTATSGLGTKKVKECGGT